MPNKMAENNPDTDYENRSSIGIPSQYTQKVQFNVSDLAVGYDFHSPMDDNSLASTSPSDTNNDIDLSRNLFPMEYSEENTDIMPVPPLPSDKNNQRPSSLLPHAPVGAAPPLVKKNSRFSYARKFFDALPDLFLQQQLNPPLPDDVIVPEFMTGQIIACPNRNNNFHYVVKWLHAKPETAPTPPLVYLRTSFPKNEVHKRFEDLITNCPLNVVPAALLPQRTTTTTTGVPPPAARRNQEGRPAAVSHDNTTRPNTTVFATPPNPINQGEEFATTNVGYRGSSASSFAAIYTAGSSGMSHVSSITRSQYSRGSSRAGDSRTFASSSSRQPSLRNSTSSEEEEDDPTTDNSSINDGEGNNRRKIGATTTTRHHCPRTTRPRPPHSSHRGRQRKKRRSRRKETTTKASSSEEDDAFSDADLTDGDDTYELDISKNFWRHRQELKERNSPSRDNEEEDNIDDDSEEDFDENSPLDQYDLAQLLRNCIEFPFTEVTPEEANNMPPPQKVYDGPSGLKKGIHEKIKTPFDAFQMSGLTHRLILRMTKNSNKYKPLGPVSRVPQCLTVVLPHIHRFCCFAFFRYFSKHYAPKNVSKSSRKWHGLTWTPITPDEMYRFLGILLRISLNPLDSGGYPAYFRERNMTVKISDSQEVTIEGTKGFVLMLPDKCRMSLNRFKQIRGAFHPEDKMLANGMDDKCYMLRSAINELNAASVANFVPEAIFATLSCVFSGVAALSENVEEKNKSEYQWPTE